MGYIEDNLMANEKVIVRGRNHIAIVLWPLAVGLFAIFLLLAAFVAAASDAGGFALLLAIPGVLFLIGAVPGFFGALIAFKSNEVAVTTRRVIGKFGLIRRSTLEFPFRQIESVAFEQGLVDRILGGAQIKIRGAGSAWVETPMLANFREFRIAAMEGVEATRSGRQHPAEADAALGSAPVGFQRPAQAVPAAAADPTPPARN